MKVKNKLQTIRPSVLTIAVHVKKLSSIFLVLAICSLYLIAQGKPKQEKICISEQEFEVYDAVGVGNYQNETTNYPFSEYAEAQLPGISPEVVSDFKEKNSKTYLLRCVLKKDQKKNKLKKYYGTTADISFSRVGFNKDETEALVYMGWSGLGNTCETDFFHLKKVNDKWKVVKKVMMVIC